MLGVTFRAQSYFWGYVLMLGCFFVFGVIFVIIFGFVFVLDLLPEVCSTCTNLQLAFLEQPERRLDLLSEVHTSTTRDKINLTKSSILSLARYSIGGPAAPQTSVLSWRGRRPPQSPRPWGNAS